MVGNRELVVTQSLQRAATKASCASRALVALRVQVNLGSEPGAFLEMSHRVD